MALSEKDQQHIDEIVTKLDRCRRLLFITGAGLSADSNLPTYRGIGGLYNDMETDEGVAIEDALSGAMFLQRPEITWKYIGQVEAACRGAQFNRGHEVMALFQERFDQVWVLTQNVDGFHHAAGSRRVIDIHGDIHDIKCSQCSYQTRVVDYRELSIPPYCPDCGAILRPDVVLFGEMLDTEKIAKMMTLRHGGVDMVFSVGTSSLFPYIVEPVLEAKRWGIPTVEINPGRTDLSAMVDHKISAGAAEVLDAVWRGLNP